MLKIKNLKTSLRFLKASLLEYRVNSHIYIYIYEYENKAATMTKNNTKW